MESLRKPVSSSYSNTEEPIFAYKNKKSYLFDMSGKTIIKLTTLLLISFVFFSILRNFIYIDIPNKCFISLDPGILEFNNASLVEGLALIKKVSPEEYKNVCQNVNRISPNVGCGGIHGGCYYENQPKKIYVNNTNRIVLYASAIIVHEACHSIQAAESRPFNENECYIADDRFIKTVVQF